MSQTDEKFQAWMRQVDAILARRIGYTSSDLADCCYLDWFEDGVRPSEAARLAIANEKGGAE